MVATVYLAILVMLTFRGKSGKINITKFGYFFFVLEKEHFLIAVGIRSEL